MKRKWIISTILVLAVVLFALLKDVFSASVYISLSFLICLSAYWSVEFIYEYVLQYHIKFEDRYQQHIILLINSSDLTSEDAELGQESLKKNFKKSLRKEKIVEIGKILFSLAIIISTIVILIRQ